MKKNLLLIILFAFVLNINPDRLYGVKKKPGNGKTKEKKAEKKKKKKPVVTEHTVKINGKKIKYTATAGYMVLKDDKGKEKANVFYVAYVKKGVKKPDERPLTFSFNGGPGSSSVWLHLGALGPKRVLMSNDGEALKPPYRLVNNQYSWLDLTDLVFIDPVWTGFSRPVDDVPKKQFHGLKEDISSVGDFIRLYTTKNKRWLSPKFLAGESYGTTRAAGLSDYLQKHFGMELNGLFLISAVLDFKTISFMGRNDLPNALFLPTYAATARYHCKKAEEGKPFESYLDEVRKWAVEDYFLALSKGSELEENAKKRLIRKLSEYTGLTEKFVENANMRINIFSFVKEFLRNQKRTVGRFDSRLKGIDKDSSGSHFEYDPSYAAVQGTFTACLNHYLREDLNFKTDIPYEILSRKVNPWNWGSASGGYVDVSESLRKSMSRNRFLKVFIGCGYYDLATPFFAVEYTIRNMQLDKSLLDNVVFRYYHAGHMMYTHKPSLVKLKKDVSKFFETVLK